MDIYIREVTEVSVTVDDVTITAQGEDLPEAMDRLVSVLCKEILSWKTEAERLSTNLEGETTDVWPGPVCRRD